MPPVVQVGDGDVEADVDHRLAAVDLLVVRRRAPARTSSPGAWMQKSTSVVVPPNAAATVAGREVVARRRAAEEHLDVRVRVDRARDHELAGGVDHLVGGDVEGLADQRDGPVLDVDVADIVVGGGDDRPPLIRTDIVADLPFGTRLLWSCIRTLRSAPSQSGSAARASRSRPGTRGRSASRTPSSPSAAGEREPDGQPVDEAARARRRRAGRAGASGEL